MKREIVIGEKTKAMIFLTDFFEELMKCQCNYPTMKRLDEDRARKRKEREDEASERKSKA